MKVLSGIDLPIDYGCGSIKLAEDLYLSGKIGFETPFIALNPEDVKYIKAVKYLLPLTQHQKLLQPKEYHSELNLLVKEIVTKEAPDVIHCHHLCFSMTSILTTIPNVKRIGFCHGTDVMEAIRSKKRRQEISTNIEKMDAIIFPSNGIYENLCQYVSPIKKKSHVIPWGIPDYFFTNSLKKLPVHDQNSFRVIYAGRINIGKSIETILKAFCILPPEVSLTIVSRDRFNSTQSKLIKRIGSRIKYMDWIDRVDLPHLLRQHQLLVLPSLEIEAFGLIVAEAQAVGLPVAISKISGLVETVPPSSSSIMFEPGNFKELASIILKLRNSVHFWESISKNGKEYANAFKMEYFIKNVKELSLTVLNQ